MPDTALNISPIFMREDMVAREVKRRHLLHRLDASRATIRLEAMEECERLSPDEIGTLLLLSDRADDWHFPKWFQGMADVAVAMVASLSIVGVVYGRTFPEYALMPHLSLYLGTWATLAAVYVVVHSGYQKNRYSVRVQESLRQVIATSRNPDIFPVLMRLLRTPTLIYQREFSYASDEALYQAAAQWILRLPTEQIRAYAIRHDALYLFLTPGRVYANPEVTLRVLYILKQVGTSSAIPVVTALTRTLHKNYQTIQYAAQDCLTVLLERERQSRQPEILLRASCAPPVQTDTMLRAASVPPPAPDTLLRPLTAQTVAAASEQLLRPSTMQE